MTNTYTEKQLKQMFSRVEKINTHTNNLVFVDNRKQEYKVPVESSISKDDNTVKQIISSLFNKYFRVTHNIGGFSYTGTKTAKDIDSLNERLNQNKSKYNKLGTTYNVVSVDEIDTETTTIQIPYKKDFENAGLFINIE